MLDGSDDPIIITGDSWLDGRPINGLWLRVIAEPDTLHYGRRPQPPGPMPPATEAFIHAAERDPTLIKHDQPDPQPPPDREAHTPATPDRPGSDQPRRRRPAAARSRRPEHS